jgi:hypothetical protein
MTYTNPDPLLIDRYEKRHKNLAAHVSPAFRVEVGDVVTVGMLCDQILSWFTRAYVGFRSVPATIKNRPFQRYPGGQEQGCCEGVRQVLKGSTPCITFSTYSTTCNEYNHA